VTRTESSAMADAAARPGAGSIDDVPSGQTRRLDPAVIVDAGLAIASEPGAQSVTVRQLGTRLGTDPTAIYRHFRSKDDLMRALLDRLMGLSLERVTAPPTQWRTYLTEVGENTLEVFLEYPVIGGEAMRLSSEGPWELAHIEGILTAFTEAGLEGEALTRYYGILSGFMLSFCSGLVRGRQTPEDDRHDAALWIDHSLPTESTTYPHVSRARRELEAMKDREIYASALALILDAAERDARA